MTDQSSACPIAPLIRKPAVCEAVLVSDVLRLVASGDVSSLPGWLRTGLSPGCGVAVIGGRVEVDGLGGVWESQDGDWLVYDPEVLGSNGTSSSRALFSLISPEALDDYDLA